jgi:hypothetical protein
MHLAIVKMAGLEDFVKIELGKSSIFMMFFFLMLKPLY